MYVRKLRKKWGTSSTVGCVHTLEMKARTVPLRGCTLDVLHFLCPVKAANVEENEKQYTGTSLLEDPCRLVSYTAVVVRTGRHDD